MKKFFIVATLIACTSAFAGEGSAQGQGGTAAKQKQQQTTDVTTTSVAGANNAGNAQSIVFEAAPAPDLSVQGSVAAGLSAQAARDVANTQSAAAIRIAEIQAAAAAAGKDLSVDQRAALDRQAAIDIANINGETARRVAQLQQTIKNTPSVSGPALTSSNDTCMGSTSGSANVPGVGLSFGTSWVDQNCKMLKNSRELWNMGMKGAAMALMCKDPDNREALELTGFECPQTTRDRKAGAAPVAAAPTVQYTDPIVRARLGLPPLK